jgi:uncharacterized protein (TIGR03790 family)
MMRSRALAGVIGVAVLAMTSHAAPRAKKATPKPERSIEVAPAKSTPEATATVVVFNEGDPDSRILARYYAAKRGVPENNLVGLTCSTQEEISRAEYDRDIALPLRAIFEKKQWWKLRAEADPHGRVEASCIHFVALMRGIPLKIAPQSEPYAGDSSEGPPQVMAHNEASVDSELAVLGVYSRRISGGLNNPYFRSYQRVAESGFPALLLVCRLDAPTPALVRRMIDDSLAAEARGLRGMAYIDARGTQDPNLIEGDKWLLNAATTARRRGMPVVLDTGAGLYPEAYPMTHAAIYLGWYAEHIAGPFVRPDFRFEAGAVAVHLHSFSGSTLRDPRRYWCAPLLAAGAAATVGNVYEPYLGLTPSLDVFFDRLRAGFSFAESSYMSQRLLSWMTTFVGDPLYQPFKNVDLVSSDHPADEWEAYALGARIWFEQGPEEGAKELHKLAKRFGSGAIFEGLGLLQLTANLSREAANTFEEAALAYREPADILRATLHEVFMLRTLKRTGDAAILAQKRIAQFPNAAGADVLRSLEAQMTEAR